MTPPPTDKRWKRWEAELRLARVCVSIEFTFTHPFFFVDGQPHKPLKVMRRQIVVPHTGALTDDALWEEHLYPLIHRDGRTHSGTRLRYPSWLGDDIMPRKWRFCDRHGRTIEHRTERELQVEQAVLRDKSGLPA